jgi:TatA/E family protein of Tat protein translocase
MGLSGLSFGHVLVVLLVVILVFGTKKLGDVGSDLGAAIKNFRKAMASGEESGAVSSTGAAAAPLSELAPPNSQEPSGAAASDRDHARTG